MSTKLKTETEFAQAPEGTIAKHPTQAFCYRKVDGAWYPTDTQFPAGISNERIADMARRYGAFDTPYVHTGFGAGAL